MPLLSTVFLSLLAVAPSAMADAGSCEAFRLDWIAGGPFNPEPIAKNGSRDAGICSGEPDQVACRLRHSGDGKQHAYVPVRDQGSNGNCTYQTTTAVANYTRSMQGLKPDVSPDYVAAQNCDSILPNGGHNITSAIDTYAKAGSCSNSELACLTNGGEISNSLESVMLDAVVHEGSPAFDPGSIETGIMAICMAAAGASDTNQTRALGSQLAEIFQKLATSRGEADNLKRWLRNPALDKATTLKKQIDAAGANAAEELKTQQAELESQGKDYLSCKIEQQFFQSLCKGKPEPPVRFKPQPYAAATSKDDRIAQLHSLVESMEGRPRPIEMRIENASALLHDPRPDGKPMPNAVGHSVLLIGQQRISGRCGFWIRNSWGTSCPSKSNPSVRCDPDRPGSIWIDADALAGPDGESGFTDMTP